jgi:hypothetical protein
MVVTLKAHVSCSKRRITVVQTDATETDATEKAGGDIVNTRIAQQQSQLATATFTMRAPMSALVSSSLDFVSIAPKSPMSLMAILTPATNAFTHVFTTNGTNVAVAEAAGANGVTPTYVAGLACTPSAAKKHDRKNNWQQRPLSLCGSPG